MGLYDDREDYKMTVYEVPPDDRINEIAREMDRLAAFGGDGKMFRMQVAGVLHAARCMGYVLVPGKLVVYDGSKKTTADAHIRKS